MSNLAEMEKRLEVVENRNRKVEADKAWETSWFRRGIVALFTYLAIGFYLQAITIPNPWLNAIVPAIAFLLSTLTLPLIKKIWLRYQKK